MKKRTLYTFLLAASFVLVPLLSFAQGGYELLAAILVAALIVYVVLGFVGIIFTIKHFKSGSKSSFLTALIISAVVYLIVTYTLSWVSRDGIFALWLIVPLVIMGLLFYKKIRDKSESIWPYTMMNLAVLSTITTLVFIVEIPGDYAEVLNVLFRGFDILSYSFFAFLLTKALLQSERQIQTQDIFIKVNLSILASYIISTIIALIRYHEASGLRINYMGFLTYLVPYIIACNLTAFVTIKFFPQKREEEERDLL
jgi:hypothetical protein